MSPSDLIFILQGNIFLSLGDISVAQSLLKKFTELAKSS